MEVKTVGPSQRPGTKTIVGFVFSVILALTRILWVLREIASWKKGAEKSEKKLISFKAEVTL
jgi:hypothetical protein